MRGGGPKTGSPDGDGMGESIPVRVFVPLREWSGAMWIWCVVRSVLAAVTLGAIVYTMWIGVRAGRWEVMIAVLAIVPWWWLLGGGTLWFVRSLIRGGRTETVLVAPNGFALAVTEDCDAVRPFWGPSVVETDEAIEICNGAFYMVARLPKAQLTEEQVAMIRRTYLTMQEEARRKVKGS